jgi:hypothetical protein
MNAAQNYATNVFEFVIVEGRALQGDFTMQVNCACVMYPKWIKVTLYYRTGVYNHRAALCSSICVNDRLFSPGYS